MKMVRRGKRAAFTKKGSVFGLNERMCFLRYGPHEYFQPHRNQAYVGPEEADRSQAPPVEECSLLTLHLYLNEADTDNDLMRGATTFRVANKKHVGGIECNVDLKAGRVLMFQHEGLRHSG